ncbi:MAG: transporter [Desulfuromonas sp.]|nr:MAG: transporter [Desulfuromonas sp.]
MKLSARNTLKGTVKEIILGQVNAEVILTLPGGEEITSIISKDAAEALKLAPGKTAYAIIKASAIVLGTDD